MGPRVQVRRTRTIVTGMLGQHRLDIADGKPWCVCGWNPTQEDLLAALTGSESVLVAHAAHLADVLTAALVADRSTATP